MKTIEEVKEHFLNNHYRSNSIKTIALFLKEMEVLDSQNDILASYIGDKTFMDFIQWFENNTDKITVIDAKTLTDYFEKEFKKIVKEEFEKCFGKFAVNPFDCCNCTCTSSKYNVEDYFKKNDEDVTDEVVCTELESIVEYLEDMDDLPIHLQRVNETLKLLIDSVERHK